MTKEQAKKVWDECPKAIDKLREWYKSQMIGLKPTGVREVDEHLSKLKDNVDGPLMIALLGESPRFLYEFFDAQSIFLTVGRYDDNEWVYSYFKVKDSSFGGNGKNRIDIENQAFEIGFLKLEQEL